MAKHRPNVRILLLSVNVYHGRSYAGRPCSRRRHVLSAIYYYRIYGGRWVGIQREVKADGDFTALDSKLRLFVFEAFGVECLIAMEISKKNVEIEALRAVATVFVIFHHSVRYDLV